MPPISNPRVLAEQGKPNEPFGKATCRSYPEFTVLFMFAHAPVDYAGALIYGSLTYFLCVWRKSLAACVVMHATANFLMGC